MMAKHAFSLGWGWLICPVLGQLSAGCSDTPDNRRLDDVPMTCTPDTAIYRLTAVDPSVRVANRIDLDGDGTPDNQLGRAHDMVVGLEPTFAVAPRIGGRLASDVPWLIAIDRCGDAARVTLDQAVGPLLFMPKVLPRAVGTFKDHVLLARDGIGRLPLVTLADALGTALAPGWIDGEGLIVELTDRGDSIDGVLAVAVATDTARAELAPPLAAFLSAQPPGDVMRQGADTDHDGVVTAAEIRGSDNYQAIVTGDVVPPHAAAPMTSIELAFTAVRIR